MGPQCRANFSAGWRPGSACISWKRAITFVQLAVNIFRRTAGNQKLLCRKGPVTCASQSLFWRLLFLGSPFNIPTWIKASAFFNVFFLITCRYLLMYLLVVGGVWLRLESAFMFFCWCIYMGLCSRSAHFCVYDKNPDDQFRPGVVPDELIQPQSDKYWAPHPQTGVFGLAAEQTCAAAGGGGGAGRDQGFYSCYMLSCP